jgi:AraC-like DNA-binding protein
VTLISVQSVLSAFDNRDFFLTFPHLSKVGWLLPTFFGPLFYLFTLKLTSKKPRFRRFDLIHFIPSLLAFIYLLPYYLRSREQKIAYLDNFELASKDDFGLLNQFNNFQLLFYLVLALLVLARYKKKIFATFSQVEHIRLRWLQQFAYFTLAILLLGMVAFYAKKLEIPVLTEIYRYHLHYLCVIIMIYWIGYKALAQPRIFGQLPQKAVNAMAQPNAETNTNVTVLNHTPELGEPTTIAAPAVAKKYQKSIVKPHDAQTYLDLLLAYMEAGKPYRQSNITIQELAAEINIPKHHLSQVINDKLGKNFYDFINQYRVAEAQLMLVNPKYKHLTNLAIAEEAGFNSKATFNAVFKKQTGQTPSEYVRNNRVANV